MIAILLMRGSTMEKFGRMFAGATNVIWTKDKHNVDKVYFQTKGKVSLAGFNERGHFLFSITKYQEEMLPKDILHIVKKRYYGKRIFGITEVNTMNKTAYLIMLDKASSWLHIKVLDDEITEEMVLIKAS